MKGKRKPHRQGIYIGDFSVGIVCGAVVGVLAGLVLCTMAWAAEEPAAAAEEPRLGGVKQILYTLPEPEEAEQAAPAEEPEPEESAEIVMDEGMSGDLELLALVIYQEAGGDMCSDETRQMVGEVVLNRVADKRYPNTIMGVICQQAQYGRLHWTGPVWPERAKNPGEQHAVERAYRMAWALLIDKVDRLLPEDVIYQAEFKQGTEVVAEAEGFYFCR